MKEARLIDTGKWISRYKQKERNQNGSYPLHKDKLEDASTSAAIAIAVVAEQ